MAIKKVAFVDRNRCVACGACAKVCPRGAIQVFRGCFAKVTEESCVGCGLCGKTCPADCIVIRERGSL